MTPISFLLCALAFWLGITISAFAYGDYQRYEPRPEPSFVAMREIVPTTPPIVTFFDPIPMPIYKKGEPGNPKVANPCTRILRMPQCAPMYDQTIRNDQ
jgi:hypothetical protein